MKRTRVLLVEDHGLVRAGMRLLIGSFPNFEVVGEASNGHDALQMLPKLRPDIILMDLSMPELNGIETTRRALKLVPRTRILVVSIHTDRDHVRRALAAGAAGYLPKSSDVDELKLALATVARGSIWISPSIVHVVIDSVRSGLAATEQDVGASEELTARQREVLQLVAEEHSTKQIARRLHLSIKTVETHRAQLMERLGIHSVAGLVRYAIRVGIIEIDE
jgi:DNA-binding NarL/FixJ family response regulator